MTVEGEDGFLLTEVQPRREKDARKFTARLNNAAKQTIPTTPVESQPARGKIDLNAVDPDAEARRLLRGDA